MRERDLMKAKKALYNENQKMNFINEVTSMDNSARTIMTVFYSSAAYENEKGTDICTWSQEELSPLLDDICGVSNASRYAKISVLRQYAKWAIRNNIPGAKNGVGKTVDKGTRRVLETSIRNPEHLQYCLDLFFAPESEKTTDDIYRCFFWLAYGGMQDSVIHTVTAKDVDFKNMLVRKDDDVSVLYRQGLPAVRNCVKLQKMKYRNRGYVNAGSVYLDRVDDPSILRGIKGKPSLLNMRTQISRKVRVAQEKYGPIPESECMTFFHVWQSGYCYRIFETELAGKEPDFMAIARASYRGRRALISGRTDAKTLLRQIASDYENDYARWKAAILPV